jgi:hypothetical protein
MFYYHPYMVIPWCNFHVGLWGNFFLLAKENVSRTHAEQNKKKTVCKNVNRFLRYSHLKNCIFRRRRAIQTAPTVRQGEDCI